MAAFSEEYKIPEKGLGSYRFYRLEDLGVIELREPTVMGFTNRLRVGKLDLPCIDGSTVQVWASQEAQCNGWGTNPPFLILASHIFRTEDDLVAHYRGELRRPHPPKRKPRVPEGLTREDLVKLGVVMKEN